MGSYLANPVTMKNSKQGQGIDFAWGSSTMQGIRTTMFDFVLNEPHLEHLRTFSLFLVFDGHGRQDCSFNAAKQLAKYLIHQELIKELTDDTNYNPESIKELIKRTIIKYDTELERIVEKDVRSGSTISGVLITPNHFFILNLGDSKTILCRDKKIAFETTDHITGNPEERNRIYNAGGMISSTYVNGHINITRSLGNYDMKKSLDLPPNQQIISAEPDVTIMERKRNQDDFIVILTDGITKRMTNQEIVDYIIKRYPFKQSEKEMCEETMEYNLRKGAKDNMAITLVKFDNSTLQKQEEKLENELKLNEKILLATRLHFQNITENELYKTMSISLKEIEEENQELFSEEVTQGFGFELKKPIIMNEIQKLKEEHHNKVRAKWLEKEREAEQSKSQ